MGNLFDVRNLNILLLIFLIIFLMPLVVSIQGNSSSFTIDSKSDVITTPNANSTSFTQRFVGGFQSVANTTSSSFRGRLGLPFKIQAIINFRQVYNNNKK